MAQTSRGWFIAFTERLLFALQQSLSCRVDGLQPLQSRSRHLKVGFRLDAVLRASALNARYARETGVPALHTRLPLPLASHLSQTS